MNKGLHYVQVAPCIPLPTGRQSYTYHTQEGLYEGTLVRIPFGKRNIDGVVVQTGVRKPKYPTKAITKITGTVLTPEQLQFGHWISYHMHGSLGYTLRLFIL